MREVGEEGEEGIYVDGEDWCTCGLWAGCFCSAQRSGQQQQASVHFLQFFSYTPENTHIY